MQALLLAAGRSTRFAPLGDKNFLKFGDKTLVERQVDTLRKAGVKKLIVVGNRENLPRLRKLFPTANFVEQTKLADGMAGAILVAKKFLDRPTLVVSNNDIFEAAAIRKVLNAKNCDGAILAQKVTQYFPGGYLTIEKNRITKIVEKPTEGRELSDLINLVCHFFRTPADLVAEIQKLKKLNDDGYERALAKLFAKQKFVAVENSGDWQAVKFPWHVLDLTAKFLAEKKSRVSKKAEIAKTAVIKNSVIEAGAKILDFAVVANSVVEKNSVVGTHSLVRDSVVGESSVVGSGSEIARSYLANRVWLHRNYVGDSILDSNVSLGSGAVTANLRLDEREINSVVKNQKTGTQKNKFGCVVGSGSRIGVNVSVMPGILISENVFVGSRVVVEKNVKKEIFQIGEFKVREIKNKQITPPRDNF